MDEGLEDFYPEQRSIELGGLFVILQRPRDMEEMVVVRLLPPRGTQLLVRPEKGRVDALCISLGVSHRHKPAVIVWEGYDDPF